MELDEVSFARGAQVLVAIDDGQDATRRQAGPALKFTGALLAHDGSAHQGVVADELVQRVEGCDDRLGIRAFSEGFDDHPLSKRCIHCLLARR